MNLFFRNPRRTTAGRCNAATLIDAPPLNNESRRIRSLLEHTAAGREMENDHDINDAQNNADG